jgi:hypothetical protein
MAPDRNRMAELHEEFLAELFGGRVSKASGVTWKDQGDGENTRMTTEFAFTWDGKATRGQAIQVTREMIGKITEQAGGNRPALGLRYYDTDDLTEVGHDWVAISAADFAELLAMARLGAELQPAAEMAGWAMAGAANLRRFEPPPPPWTPPPPPMPLHGQYPPDLPVPPHELWPCLVVDSRHDPAEEGRLVSNGYYVNDSGQVSPYSIGSCRIERGTGTQDRLVVNDQNIHRGMWFADGVARLTVGGPRR